MPNAAGTECQMQLASQAVGLGLHGCADMLPVSCLPLLLRLCTKPRCNAKTCREGLLVGKGRAISKSSIIYNYPLLVTTRLNNNHNPLPRYGGTLYSCTSAVPWSVPVIEGVARGVGGHPRKLRTP